MSKSNVFFKCMFTVFILESMYTFLPHIMPMGFIILVPVAVLVAYSEWLRFRAWTAKKKMQREMESELREMLASTRVEG